MLRDCRPTLKAHAFRARGKTNRLTACNGTGLAAGLTSYRTAGLTGSAPAASDSTAGQAILTAHFPPATAAADQVLLRFDHPVAGDRSLLATVQSQLAGSPVFASISGPLGAGAETASQPDRRFVSSDGRTVQYFAVLRAGPVGSTAAVSAIPEARAAIDRVWEPRPTASPARTRHACAVTPAASVRFAPPGAGRA